MLSYSRKAYSAAVLHQDTENLHPGFGVNEMFTTFRERFGGKRKDGARRMRYVDQKEGLYCLRNLQARIIGP